MLKYKNVKDSLRILPIMEKGRLEEWKRSNIKSIISIGLVKQNKKDFFWKTVYDSLQSPKKEVKRGVKAREKENSGSKDLVGLLNSNEIPKGVLLSSLILNLPIVGGTGWLLYLLMVNPAHSMGLLLSRGLVRALALLVAYNGGIHFGLAAAAFQNIQNPSPKLQKSIINQLILSFLPSCLSFTFSSLLLFSNPVLNTHIIFCFSGIILTSLTVYLADIKAIQRGVAPFWFTRFRLLSLTVQILVSCALLYAWITYREWLDRGRDSNRVQGILNAKELEDREIEKMVHDYEGLPIGRQKLALVFNKDNKIV